MEVEGGGGGGEMEDMLCPMQAVESTATGGGGGSRGDTPHDGYLDDLLEDNGVENRSRSSIEKSRMTRFEEAIMKEDGNDIENRDTDPICLRKRHGSIPPPAVENSSPEALASNDGETLPIHSKKRRASPTTSALCVDEPATPGSEIGGAELGLTYRLLREKSRGMSPAQQDKLPAASAAAAKVNDDGGDADRRRSSFSSSSRTTACKTFHSPSSTRPTTTATATAAAAATTRNFLLWNGPPSEEESDSGWSSASRPSSSSVMSSSSSFDSELSSVMISSYRPRQWWPERQREMMSMHDGAVYDGQMAREVMEEDEEEEDYVDYASDAGQSVLMRRMFHSVMHGVVLALQSLAALAVLSVFVWMTVWKNPDAEPAFWEWLWEIPSMATTSVLLLCVVTMITHEVRVLSAVALLYLQAAIFLMTSVSVLIMWLTVAEQSGELVQSILVGCCVFLWGMACLGFLRAVVIWRVMEFEEGAMMAQQQGLMSDDVETYGTLR